MKIITFKITNREIIYTFVSKVYWEPKKKLQKISQYLLTKYIDILNIYINNNK